MNKVKRNIVLAIVLCISISVSYLCAVKYLDAQIENLYDEKHINVDKTSGIPEKEKGNTLVRCGLRNGSVLLLGSSELASPVPENPKNLFPNNKLDGNITFAGRSVVQNLLQAMNVAANCTENNENKVVIMEGLQWFFGDDIDVDGTMSNFSELQFYQCLNNDSISEKNKTYLAKRFLDLQSRRESKTTGVLEQENSRYRKLISNIIRSIEKVLGYEIIEEAHDYPQTYILAKLYLSDSISGRIGYMITKPYYYCRYKLMVLKDKVQAYRFIKSIDEKDVESEEIKQIDWDEIQRIGEAEGRKACTNNDLYVYDEYYSNYLEAEYASLKDIYAGAPIMRSKEWDDYQFFLDICKDLNIKPYIVIMSTNGFYYDYTGITSESRIEAYNKIENNAAEESFPVLNLKDFEYTPYFYCDVMHLGWKGWPYVSEKICEHYSN